jgi:hypothetical protein
MSKRILTPQVLKAQHELILALQAAARESGLSRDEAQGKLSAVISDVWNEVEKQIVCTIPLSL